MSRCMATSRQERLVWEEAQVLHRKGFVVFPVTLWDDNGQKRAKFPNAWQRCATHSTCLSLFDNFDFNGLAIKTGKESDTYVVDLDVLKPKDVEDGLIDGVELLTNKFRENKESMDNHLVANTANNGKHLYFSYSKSDAAGLRQLGNTAKISVNGSKTTIDIRGEGGCVFAAPTSFAGKSYAWMSEVPRTEDLSPCPPWLISMLNDGAKQRPKAPKRSLIDAGGHSVTARQRVVEDDCPINNTDSQLTAAYGDVTAVQPMIESELGVEIKQWYPKPYGGDFHVVDKLAHCGICVVHIHTSNGYSCNIIIPPCCIVKNYSPQCHAKIIGLEDVPSLVAIKIDPYSDDAFVNMFVEHQRYRGRKWLWFKQDSCFLKYDGTIYKRMDREDIGQDIIKDCSDLLTKLAIAFAQTKKMLELQTSTKKLPEDVLKWDDSLTKASRYLHKAAAVDHIIKRAVYQLYDSTLQDKMDMDPNLIGCQNGVIHLETGALVLNNSDMYVSRQAEVEYRGLDHPSPDIDAFLSSIFNHDKDLIKYMQRLLGYGMTGLCREEVFVVFYGAGGNGKSLLNKLIKGVLGPYWSTMSRDCVFKSERRAGPGAPSPHLAMLKGLRIAVLDDCNEQEVLDDGTIKKMTSGVPMEARMLNQNPVIFTPTHLAIVCTNHLPKINVDDEAIERRLVLTPFANNYRAPDTFDPENPTHRPIDMTLGERLASPEVLEQFLSWIVRGAVAWYKEGLGAKPAALSAAQEEYYQENDIIGQFIRDHCETGQGFRVSPSTFKQTLEGTMQHVYTGEKIKKALLKKGFAYKKTHGQRFFCGLSPRMEN